jgi:hypothetical protein
VAQLARGKPVPMVPQEGRGVMQALMEMGGQVCHSKIINLKSAILKIMIEGGNGGAGGASGPQIGGLGAAGGKGTFYTNKQFFNIH